MTKKMVDPGGGGGDFALGSAAGRIGSGGNLGFGSGGSGKVTKPKEVKKPKVALKKRKRVEVPKTRKSPTRNKAAKEHEARMKEFYKPENVAKRDAEFKKMMAEAKRERLSRSDGHKPKTAEGTGKFKINKKSSSSVALLKRDRKEHETAAKIRSRWDKAWRDKRGHLFKKGI